MNMNPSSSGGDKRQSETRDGNNTRATTLLNGDVIELSNRFTGPISNEMIYSKDDSNTLSSPRKTVAAGNRRSYPILWQIFTADYFRHDVLDSDSQGQDSDGDISRTPIHYHEPLVLVDLLTGGLLHWSQSSSASSQSHQQRNVNIKVYNGLELPDLGDDKQEKQSHRQEEGDVWFFTNHHNNNNDNDDSRDENVVKRSDAFIISTKRNPNQDSFLVFDTECGIGLIQSRRSGNPELLPSRCRNKTPFRVDGNIRGTHFTLKMADDRDSYCDADHMCSEGTRCVDNVCVEDDKKPDNEDNNDGGGGGDDDDDDDNENENQKNKKKRRTWRLIRTIVIVGALLAGLVFILSRLSKRKPPEQNVIQDSVDDDNLQQERQYLYERRKKKKKEKPQV